MAVDFERLRDQIVNLVTTDPDGKYIGEMAQPVDSPELEAWAHYMARAILDEITTHARIDAGIEVEDSGGTLIGSTRQSDPGQIE